VPARRPDTQAWRRQAEADLTSAELLFSGEHYFTASWYSHQAAEKAIKALYIERFGRDASRVHDLNLLGRHAGVPIDIQRVLARLDSAFGLSRYPNAVGAAPVDTLTVTHGTRYIEAARRVLEWVREQL
jgi:HEPN domain-containing protein